MPLASSSQSAIVLTDHGLTIAGTRITLYDVMDHLAAGWTPKLIANWLPLTEEQINAALSYIDANRSEVEADYQTGLQETQARRKYWEEKNHERLTEIAQMPPKPRQEAIHAKLQAWKAELGLTE